MALTAARPAAAAALAVLVACLALQTAQAAHIYTGPASFLNTMANATTLELDGATLRLADASQVYGLSKAGMSALHITLKPCTILQPHVHPHAEFSFVIAGEVTNSIVFNNGTLTNVTENTATMQANPSFAVFPAGTLHVTQNEGCTDAVVISVFPVGTVDAYFFPYSEAYLPKNTVASYFQGEMSNEDLWTPFATAKLDGCSCTAGGRRMAM